MKDIAIYGAGGFGREIACLIEKINEQSPKWNFIGFFDDGLLKGSKNEYGKILGGIEELNNFPSELSIAIAIASPSIVEKIVKNITSPKTNFPNIISPDVVFLDSQNINIGKGNILSFGCIISCNVKIGNFNIFNWRITIGHDTCIKNYNAFMPETKISGKVSIGNNNFFGVNSTILQQISIGNDTIIGASSLVLRKTKDGMTYVGNPASIIKY